MLTLFLHLVCNGYRQSPYRFSTKIAPARETVFPNIQDFTVLFRNECVNCIHIRFLRFCVLYNGLAWPRIAYHPTPTIGRHDWKAIGRPIQEWMRRLARVWYGYSVQTLYEHGCLWSQICFLGQIPIIPDLGYLVYQNRMKALQMYSNCIVLLSFLTALYLTCQRYSRLRPFSRFLWKWCRGFSVNKPQRGSNLFQVSF